MVEKSEQKLKYVIVRTDKADVYAGYLTPKNYAGAEPLTVPVGTYEYKVYAGDVLVAVFPFEVR